jgi:2-dehydropantoate 2-reductase
MRILILGAGATGGYFGGRLAEAGVDVTFLVRPRRAETLAREGLVVESPLGGFRCQVATVLEADAGYDAVVVACKAFDLESAMLAIEPAMKGTAVLLPLLNGLAHYDKLDQAFGAERVLGGLCHIGVTLSPSGVVQHLNEAQYFTMGARFRSQIGIAQALHGEMCRGGFNPTLAPDISQDMWDKFVLLASYAGMTCLMRAPIGIIMRTVFGRQMMHAIIDECEAVARRSGRAPDAARMRAIRLELTLEGSAGTASMLRDMNAGRRTEHDHILMDMVHRGEGLELPLLRSAHTGVQAVELLRDAGLPARLGSLDPVL